MRHDIYAYKREYEDGAAREALYLELCMDKSMNEKDFDANGMSPWRRGFEAYGEQTQIAYFRRSMGYYKLQHGALLYTVLGEKAQKHDAGVSGDGGEERFGGDEIGRALTILTRMAEDPTNDVADELAFIQKCAEALNWQRDVLIAFG